MCHFEGQFHVVIGGFVSLKCHMPKRLLLLAQSCLSHYMLCPCLSKYSGVIQPWSTMFHNYAGTNLFVSVEFKCNSESFHVSLSICCVVRQWIECVFLCVCVCVCLRCVLCWPLYFRKWRNASPHVAMALSTRANFGLVTVRHTHVCLREISVSVTRPPCWRENTPHCNTHCNTHIR